MGSTRMKVRTAESRLRNRLRAYMRNSGYIDNLPLGRKPRDGEDLDEDLDVDTETEAGEEE